VALEKDSQCGIAVGATRQLEMSAASLVWSAVVLGRPSGMVWEK